ncbi:MAG TPA: penicillin acylase family protein, partial [Algoriphagus sp.]|nr:penicillin acylase family protein [Algoriphagus sp.]
MKYFSFIFVLLITLALGYFASVPIGPAPPMGPLMDPNHGFWQNMYSEDEIAEDEIAIPGLQGTVSVTYDENLIPHIFAQNE